MSSPVASLDKSDFRILKQLNTGLPMPRPIKKNRLDKLLQSGCVEETNFGEMVITVRGQLELARWRFRRLPKTKLVISGPAPREALLDRLLSFRRKTKTA